MPSPNLFIVYVTDPASSAAFYSEIFGIEPSFRSPRFIEFPLASGISLALWSGADHAPEPSTTRTSEICLNLEGGKDRIDEEFRRWQGLGVTMVKEPHDDIFGRTFVAADPDGNLLRVAPVDPQ